MPEEITDCRYTNAARESVRCLIGGRPSSVPVDMGNRHWRQIVQQQIPVADPE